MIRKTTAFLSAVIVTYVLAAIASTQSVLDSLREIGIPVSRTERLEAIAHDLVGMATTFLPLIALALLIAFLLTGAILRWLPKWRTALYIISGAAAIVGLHLILRATFDITPVAAARTGMGLAIQALAGAVGGYAFIRLG